MIIHDVEPVRPVNHKLVLWKNGHDGMHAISLGGFETRHQSVLTLLDQAEEQHGAPAFGPLVIHTDDRPIAAVADSWCSYAFCTAAGYRDVPVPDFVFDGWPQAGIDEFDETTSSMAGVGTRPAELPVVGWIGSCNTNPVRSVLQRLGQEHPDLLDVHHVDWVQGPQARLQTSAGNHLSLSEQVRRWRALLDVEGHGYSGRLKLLLHSGRPVLVQERPWREWYWDSLVPMEHYVPVRSDLSDLLDRARWVQENPHEAEQVGRSGQQLAQQLLTRASAVARWSRTLSFAARTKVEEWAPQPLRDDLIPVLRQLDAPL